MIHGTFVPNYVIMEQESRKSGNGGRSPFSQNFRQFRWAVNEKRFTGSSHRKIPRKSGKSEKVGPFSRLERSERNCAFHPHLSRSSYQFEAHGKKICHGQFAKQLASLEPSLMYQSGAPYVNFWKISVRKTI